MSEITKKIAFGVDNKSISSPDVFRLLALKFARAFKHTDNFSPLSYFEEKHLFGAASEHTELFF